MIGPHDDRLLRSHQELPEIRLGLRRNGSGKADYLVSGVWSKKAAAEASRYGDVKIVASSADQNFSCVPEVDLSSP